MKDEGTLNRSSGTTRRPHLFRLAWLVLRNMVAPGMALALLASSACTALSRAGAGTPAFSVDSLTSSVSGSLVEVTAMLTADQRTVVDEVVICVRDDAGNSFDFPANRPLEIISAGTQVSQAQRLGPGVYRYFICSESSGVLNRIGAAQTFTVDADLIQSRPLAMPSGDLPGWRQVFADDFDQDVELGGFPGPYAGRWMSYDGFPDTSEEGQYEQDIISVRDGALGLYLHTMDGKALSAAPIPLVNGKWGGQTYGRFSMRMRSDAVRRVGIASLLWSDAEIWDEGEINFPEGNLSGTSHAYNHCIGDPRRNCLAYNTRVSFADWHVYTIEWTPKKISYLLDGVVVASTTKSIPSTPMHWVIQTGTSGEPKSSQSFAGHLYIDWATIYAWEPDAGADK